MKKFLLFLCAVTLVFGMLSSASANLITNGDFEAGLSEWNTYGDVQIGDTSDPGGWLASAQGMVGQYAVLGLDVTDGVSRIRQDFDITGADKFTISFNWAFDYWDNSTSADDTFLSLVRQDGSPAYRVTLIDLETHGTGVWSSDGGLAYGYYTDTIDLSNYITDDARLVFRLIEEADSCFFTGTASVVGIDNVNVAPVPEPSTILLLGLGLIGMVGYGRKRFSKKG